MASGSGGPAATHKSRRHHHHHRIEPIPAYDDHHHHHHGGAASADTTAFSAPLIFRPKSTPRRNNNNPSLSSSSSFSSLNSSSSSNGSLSLSSLTLPDDSPFSTPARTPLSRFSGVPFSWEQIPGKPKNEEATKKQDSAQSSLLLLPLPPANNNNNSSSFRKNSNKEIAMIDNLVSNISPRKSSYDPNESFRKDPFFAAFVECSKDDVHLHRKYWNGSLSSPSTKMVPAKSNLIGRFGFINMYSSCKMSCGVAESMVLVPRRRSSRAYNLINRRSI
ncbi:OLC1v1015567C1 [Oldenlandia corymbosa var. corymbosa]|uniref:OLC1v1015567C1 n=1 Tax=Oldenlandia corymbosa var. corymbosa TaxID=529605 RepID=A0AAV1E5W7_OLDCO|nr:OLC1v1015567C1 [Oldenlandia corymbosa var. corymbosa]